ncbi:MAG: diacylglycerol kinase family lipid kinase [Flavobacteriaceae bacterium]|nr:diacylglycerol kinase family lipid kinase [Flavobacteriaceae bacterium]
MANKKSWFVIINPTSGNGSGKKKWSKIERLLNTYGFDFDYAFTMHQKHSVEIVQQVIDKGFFNIISVGGDGTLHNIVNGIMLQSKMPSTNITVGVIPIGTGNDWIKTHHIPKDIESAIQIIKNGKAKLQDVGKIELLDQKKESIYFINLAGVGFDGYVVSRVEKYKRFGALAYLFGTLFGLVSFKNFNSKVRINSENISGKTLMVLIGLCEYSGGGMKLTKKPNPFDGFFDVSVAKNFSKLDILFNAVKLYNGKIVDFKKVVPLIATSIKIEIQEEKLPYIQADGELIGKGGFRASIIPKNFRFYCK